MVTFEVTAQQAAVKVDAAGKGRAGFGATAAAAIRGRALTVPLGAAQAGWFSVEGDPQRMFQPWVAERFEVNVEIPAGTTGDLGFRLDVVGIDNPDEQYGRGPEVKLQLVGSALPPPRSRGYLMTFVGAVAGAVVGGVIGTLPGSLIFFQLTLDLPPAHSFGEAIGQALVGSLVLVIVAALVLLLGIVIGLWLGAVIGAYVALRIRSHPRAGWTALALAILQPIWIVLALLGGDALSNAIKGSNSSTLILVLVGVAIVLVPAWPARAVVRLIGEHRL
ncbi:MAG: hypothetical protein ABI838_03095 [Chloroflexota bacterium]